MKCMGPFESRDCYPWSSAHPGLFIFTVDQSMDMKVNYSLSRRRAEFASDLVNGSIMKIININLNGTQVKNRCYIIVLGYASQVNVLCEGWLSNLCESTKRIEQVVLKLPDGDGESLDFEEQMPVWIDSKTCETKTDLSILTTKVQKVVNSWRKDNCTVPIIINLTAGNHSGRYIQFGFELKDCLVCNVLCKHVKEVDDDEKLFWRRHSSSNLPEKIIWTMKMYGYDINSLFLDSSMLYAFVSAPFYARDMFTI